MAALTNRTGVAPASQKHINVVNVVLKNESSSEPFNDLVSPLALAQEIDERGIGHLTASTTVNRPSRDDLVIYLARATVFNGKIRIQSLGSEAERYGGKLVEYAGEKRLQLRYDDWNSEQLPVEEITYQVRDSGL